MLANLDQNNPLRVVGKFGEKSLKFGENNLKRLPRFGRYFRQALLKFLYITPKKY